MNSRFLIIAVAFIVVGLAVFYAGADFNNTAWQHAYGLWDKSKDCLLLLLIGMSADKKTVRILAPAFWLIVARLAWEAVSACTGKSINDIAAIKWLFLIASFVILFYTIKHLPDDRN